MKAKPLTPVAKISPFRSNATAVTGALRGLKACLRHSLASPLGLRPVTTCSLCGSYSSSNRTTPSSKPVTSKPPLWLTYRQTPEPQRSVFSQYTSCVVSWYIFAPTHLLKVEPNWEQFHPDWSDWWSVLFLPGSQKLWLNLQIRETQTEYSVCVCQCVCKQAQYVRRCGNVCHSRSRAVVAIRWDFLDTSRPWIAPAWKENRHSGSGVCTHRPHIICYFTGRAHCLFQSLITTWWTWWYLIYGLQSNFPLGPDNITHTSSYSSQ